VILSLLPDRLAVCRLEPSAEVPGWPWGGSLASVSRTPDEVSVVCTEEVVPADVLAERGWRGFKVEGPLVFAMTGVLASLAVPLAEAAVSIFALSTYDSDYVLVPETRLSQALGALRGAGHTVRDE
jgi:hypothetical protein